MLGGELDVLLPVFPLELRAVRLVHVLAVGLLVDGEVEVLAAAVRRQLLSHPRLSESQCSSFECDRHGKPQSYTHKQNRETEGLIDRIYLKTEIHL